MTNSAQPSRRPFSSQPLGLPRLHSAQPRGPLSGGDRLAPLGRYLAGDPRQAGCRGRTAVQSVERRLVPVRLKDDPRPADACPA